MNEMHTIELNTESNTNLNTNTNLDTNLNTNILNNPVTDTLYDRYIQKTYTDYTKYERNYIILMLIYTSIFLFGLFLIIFFSIRYDFKYSPGIIAITNVVILFFI